MLRIELGIAATELGDWSILDARPVPAADAAPAARPARRRRPGGAHQRLRHRAPRHVRGGPAARRSRSPALDATHAMNLQEKVTPWPNMPDSAIAAAIFGQYAILPRVDPTSPVLVEPEGTTIQRGTDIRFLRRLARRNGFDCYVQPEPLTGLDVGHFQPRAADRGAAGGAHRRAWAPRRTSATSASATSSTRPTTAVAAGLDVLTKAPQPALAPAALAAAAGHRADAAAAAAAADRPPGRHRAAAHRRAPAGGAGDRRPLDLVGRSPRGRSAPTSACCGPAGSSNVRGAGRLYNGSYYVTRVRHTIKTRRHRAALRGASATRSTETGAELYVEVA